MKIDVIRLGDGQSCLMSESWDPKEFELEIPGSRLIENLNVEAKACRDNAAIKVKVLLTSQLELTCSRCSRAFTKPLRLEYNFLYPVDLSKRVIILDDDIREELILNYPQKNLCKEDCKGLCSKCGADLNEGVCKCKRNE